MLTQAELKSQLHYEPLTGLFTRNKNRKIAGWLDKTNGYIKIDINNKNYYAHRLAFLYMVGAFPSSITDHKDRKRDNNIWENLRESTFTQNLLNVDKRSDNTTGFKGVTFSKKRKAFIAQTTLNGEAKYLGQFENAQIAHCAYMNFAKQNHGEFIYERK